MADPSSILRTPPFGLSLIRQRVKTGRPRSALVDTPLTQAAPDKRAAVAAIVREVTTHGPEVLLIRRAEHPNDPWSGHMAFPGGREDPRDANLLATAMRETHEEVALDLARSARLIGRLDDLPVTARGRRMGLTVAPFVFELTEDAPLIANEEVAELVWAPLEPMFRGAMAVRFPYKFGGEQLDLPAHDIGGRIVWGLTHRMLENLFTLLR